MTYKPELFAAVLDPSLVSVLIFVAGTLAAMGLGLLAIRGATRTINGLPELQRRVAECEVTCAAAREIAEAARTDADEARRYAQKRADRVARVKVVEKQAEHDNGAPVQPAAAPWATLFDQLRGSTRSTPTPSSRPRPVAIEDADDGK